MKNAGKNHRDGDRIELRHVQRDNPYPTMPANHATWAIISLLPPSRGDLGLWHEVLPVTIFLAA